MLAAIELIRSTKPSVILATSDDQSVGALLQGGVAAVSPSALAQHNVGYVVSAAANLGGLFVSYKKYVEEAQTAMGVVFLTLPWTDVVTQVNGKKRAL